MKHNKFHEDGTEYRATIGLPVKRYLPVYDALLVGRWWPALDVYWAVVEELLLFDRLNINIFFHSEP